MMIALACQACAALPSPLVTQAVPATEPPALATSTAIPATPAPTSTASSPSPTDSPSPTSAVATQSPENTAVPTLTEEQLRNATLTFTGSDQMIRTVSFINGKYEEGSDANQASHLIISLGEQIAFGDLNADGAQDAVVSIGENYGGTGVFVSILAILNEHGQPNAVALAGIEDRGIINQLKIEAGQIMVDATVHGPGDPMCCATQPTTRVYRLVENNLELSRLSTKTANGADRVILISAPANGAEISGAFVIQGSVTVSPFENNLGYRVFKQGEKEPLDQAGFTISADGLGGPGTFELTLDPGQKGFSGPLRIEIFDSSPADGSTLALATLYLTVK
jgi:hypothetical protein